MSDETQQSSGAERAFESEVLRRLAGRRVVGDRYELKGEVARGGQGAILRVWDRDLRRNLAMKVVLGAGATPEEAHPATPAAVPEEAQVDPKTLGRFLEEAQVTSQLDHPGIVPVHELGLDPEGRCYFTMKLVKGQDLARVFELVHEAREGWTETRALHVLLKVCEALAYAHSKDVIHRDLKPANIMVGRYGEVYVMDWGLAKVLGREDDKDIRLRPSAANSLSVIRTERREESADSPLITMDGDVVGTPAYMSPEQASGDLAAMGPASDVYAMGAILYHLLAGHMPYVPPGAQMNAYVVWGLVQNGPPNPIGELARGAPEELVAICEKAMQRDPGQRYADTQAMAGDLAAYLEGRVVRAHRTGALIELVKWTRRNRALAASLSAAVLIALAGLAGMSYVQAEGRRLAELERMRAQDSERDALELTAKVLRLSDMQVLRQLEAEAEALWPSHPEKIAAMENWLRRARELAANLPTHRETLEQMRASAPPWTAEEQARDRATHPSSAYLAKRKADLADWTQVLDSIWDAEVPPLLEQHALEAHQNSEYKIADTESEIGALSKAVAMRRTWNFDSTEERWQHDMLSELTSSLEAFEASLLSEDSVSPGSGWSMPKRLAFARELEAGFQPGGQYAQAWSESLPAIREAYPGLALEPQLGLLPVGPDPDSGLWEFAHLMTGVPVTRGEDGRLVPTEATGLVLVLIPPGSFQMGYQAANPKAPNYNPSLASVFPQLTVRDVELSAFLLSKYEMTQEQWHLATGLRPSSWRVPMHPVELVSWQECSEVMLRLGLTLPSEAQWEYATRAGTTTPWSLGRVKEDLRGKVNIADRTAREAELGFGAVRDWPDLVDGSALHASVGTYPANAFGLHEVHGNVAEFCLDSIDSGWDRSGPLVDPVFTSFDTWKAMRGGSYFTSASATWSANRSTETDSFKAEYIGLRPARLLSR